MPKLIGIYNANGGFLGELAYLAGHMVGRTGCELCSITHTPLWKKPSWNAMTTRLQEDLGYEFILLHKNETTDEQKEASAGREPCILLEVEPGHYSMILDWNDLKLAGGNVGTFERILKAKLLMY